MTCKQCGGELIKMKSHGRNRQKEAADQEICLSCQLSKLGWVQE